MKTKVFSYKKFETESDLKKAIEQINKTRKKEAFFAHEKPVSIRTFQASGSYEYGSITYIDNAAIDAEWNFKAYF
jgi:hypothetical protein